MPVGAERVGDIAGADRTVELGTLARLAQDHHRRTVDGERHPLGLALALEILGLELGAAALEGGQRLIGRPERLALRDQEVAREARAHLHDLAHLAEFRNALEEDDLHELNSV